METRSSGSDVQCFVVLLVGNSKIQFELWPCFVRRGLALPDFAIIGKDASAKNKLVRNIEDLFWGIRGLPCSGKFDGIFDLLV
jgi:hypothetical protein